MSDPNLIELYAVFSDKENIYLIQELGIDGQLYELMRKKFKFSEESTALVSREILKGIKYMHSKHIIHRDIKP
jgi:serine/threonine protein kinase